MFFLPRRTDSSTSRGRATAMEIPFFCPSLQLQENSFLFDCESLPGRSCHPLAFDPASDPGYHSAGSSLSPTSSVDSFILSPASLRAAGNGQSAFAFDRLILRGPTAATHPTRETRTPPSATDTSGAKKSRSRYRGKKRQTASEREKLRMRDLTKALHHLRTYLPPSVAPAGQTLTKIETLRLTIRYISYLSAHLGLSEEALEQRRPPGFVERPQTLSQYLGQPISSYSRPEPDGLNAAQLSSLQPSCQVSDGASFTSSQYWLPQQQLQSAAFSGQR